MNTLFPIEPSFPTGFAYDSDFLNEDEEMELYKEIEKLELHEFTFQGFKANRKVASFGYDYSFENGSLTKGKNILPAFDFLIEKVSRHLSIIPSEFAELLVTQYRQALLLTGTAMLHRLILLPAFLSSLIALFVYDHTTKQNKTGHL